MRFDAIAGRPNHEVRTTADEEAGAFLAGKGFTHAVSLLSGQMSAATAQQEWGRPHQAVGP
jgi:hypothetical protein